jgi:hypothetical protein
MFGFLDGGTPRYVRAGQPASGSSGAAIGTAGSFGNGTPHYLGAGQPGSDGGTRGIFGFLSSWLAGMRPVYVRAPSSSGQVAGQDTAHAAAIDAGQPAPTATEPMQPGPTATSVAQHSQ